MASRKSLVLLGIGAFGALILLSLFGATTDSNLTWGLAYGWPFCFFMGLALSKDVSISTTSPWGVLVVISTLIAGSLAIVVLPPITPQQIDPFWAVFLLLVTGFIAVGWTRLLTQSQDSIMRETSARPWLLISFAAVLVLVVVLRQIGGA